MLTVIYLTIWGTIAGLSVYLVLRAAAHGHQPSWCDDEWDVDD